MQGCELPMMAEEATIHPYFLPVKSEGDFAQSRVPEASSQAGCPYAGGPGGPGLFSPSPAPASLFGAHFEANFWVC